MSKIVPRKTAQRVHARRITAPETETDESTGKKVPLLSYIDSAAYMQHKKTSLDLFLYASGDPDAPGEPVLNGLDRLLHHDFVVHLNSADRAIGLDIIPSRLYRSGVTMESMAGVKTLKVEYLVGGAVARVTQRPQNTRFGQSRQVVEAIDEHLARTGSLPQSGDLRLRNVTVGRVVGLINDTVEVRLAAIDQRPSNDPRDMVDDLDDSDNGETTSSPEGSVDQVPG